mgnify:CR=1 FL=1
MRENMEQHFNTPAEVIDNNMKAGEGKAHLPLGKMILLGIMAGAFIALGGATSSTAAHAIDNVGLARFVAGIIFPVGLMIIVFVGGELFTGNCLIVMDGGLLGAYAIKVAVGKVGISPLKGITSGILCNILVCIAILMAAAATDIVGKVWAIFFPIMAFVVGGFEHCVANMFYIPVGMMAAQNPAYVAKAQEAYGLTAEQIQGLTVLHSLNNFIPVTIGNILGGMVFVGIPCYFIYKKKWQKWHEESKNA